MELEGIVLGGHAYVVPQPGDALHEADRGLIREEPYAQQPSPGLDEDKAKLVTVMAALEHARPVHVPTFSSLEATCNGLAVAVAPMSKGTRPPGGESDVFVEGLIAGGPPKLLDVREETGRGTEDGRDSETEPGSHDHMTIEGRRAAWAADLLRGLQDRRRGFVSARGAVHETRNGYAGISGVVMNDIVVEVERDDVTILERMAAKCADVGSREPSSRVPPRNKRTRVGRAVLVVVQGAGGR